MVLKQSNQSNNFATTGIYNFIGKEQIKCFINTWIVLIFNLLYLGSLEGVNEECLWVMAVEWFYLLLKPLLVALVDHVLFTCFQV